MQQNFGKMARLDSYGVEFRDEVQILDEEFDELESEDLLLSIAMPLKLYGATRI